MKRVRRPIEKKALLVRMFLRSEKSNTWGRVSARDQKPHRPSAPLVA
jgi:hypothetical protein